MQQINESEKLRKCFQALGINHNNAYNILVAEMARIDFDERIPERKSVTVSVFNENQKIIAETIILLIKSQRGSKREISFEPDCINVEVANSNPSLQSEDNVIDLGNFDFEKEKDKLIRRCNATIIGNAQIREILNKENRKSIEEMRAIKSEYQEERAAIVKEIDDLEYKAQDYEDSVFYIFFQKRLRAIDERLDELETNLDENDEEYEKEREYRAYSYQKRSARISGLYEKESSLQGVKYLFTGVREKLVESRDQKGNVIRTFIPDDTLNGNSSLRSSENFTDR